MEPNEVKSPESKSVEFTSDRNGIDASCDITIATDEPAVIWIRVETSKNLPDAEGDIRQRISELLNQGIRALFSE